MYSTVFVPVDNSDHSNACMDLAVRLGKAFGSQLVGSHVYAAKLHDVRFKQMEFTLPDEYKEEEELEKQRKIHDALIARGLHLISDSYLDQMEVRATEAGIPFLRKHFDGKNFEAIVRDVNESAYDLVILGALGMGAVKDSQVGSVCERTLRRTRVDTLVVRDTEPKDIGAAGPIVVALDGSAESYGGMKTALDMARTFSKGVVVLAVAEPGRGDAALLAAHLEVAQALAHRAGIAIESRLVEGSARQELLAQSATLGAWLLVVGRIGIDATDASDVGGTAESLLRTATCNVLLSSRTLSPAEALAAA